MTPADRTDIIEECRKRLSVLEEYAPKMMNEEEIRAVVLEVLSGLGIEKPESKDQRPHYERTDAQSKGKG